MCYQLHHICIYQTALGKLPDTVYTSPFAGFEPARTRSKAALPIKLSGHVARFPGHESEREAYAYYDLPLFPGCQI